MVKVIITDLDETLLNHERLVSKRNKEAILLAKEKGIKFIPATGRPYHSISSTLESLDLYGDDDLSISFNGGMIHNNKDDSVLAFNSLDDDIAAFLFHFGQSFDVCIHTYLEHVTYAYRLNDSERDFIKNIKGVEEIFDDSFSFAKGHHIIKMIFQSLDIDYLRDIEQKIPDHIKDKMEISYSSNRYLELNPKGVNKGNALNIVAQTLDIPLTNILAIGDNYNDMSMLVEAGYSAAPNNAVDAIHVSVDYVSPYRFDEDAVADIIEHFIK